MISPVKSLCDPNGELFTSGRRVTRRRPRQWMRGEKTLDVGGEAAGD
ncbi:hypothetical protein OCAR_5852 [Afipia carboxidovorans OM5]|nr:hypothetical protein OCAR_5852 [Afipia carboxidovorans OM5]